MARDHHQFYGQNHHHNHHHHHHHQHQMINQIQGFDETTNQNQTGHHHHHHYNHQIFGSNSNMGMMIDFSKQQQIRMDHHHHQTSGGTDPNQLLEDSSSSMRLCSVNNINYPSEVDDERPPQRPSQGLSLSLSSSNPTSINLQSFELRPHQQQEIYSGKAIHHQNLQHTQMMMMMMNSQHQHQNNNNQQHHNQFLIGSSKYLSPAQELLSEFCSLGVKESDEEVMMMKHKKKQKGKQQQEDWDTSHNNNDHQQQDQSATTSSKKHVPPLHSLEFMELQKRKAKLLSMFEELKRRYGHYREQMRLAAAGFEAAVGVGAAEIYTALASRAMSRHFRCLKDGLVGQIQATSQALGEREDDNRAVSIAARGETPRLRLLDQALRQQKSYRQMSLVDAHPWRPQRGLPDRAVTTLRAWLFEHFLHPYPSDVDKHILARQTGLSRSQVSNWFINARVRLWKPMIEEMYCEETRGEDVEITNTLMVKTKPDPNQIIPVEPESLSSIVAKTGQKNNLNQGTASFGSTFDFSLYGNQAVTYAGEGGTRGDVSLTLGLQRNDGNGVVSLALSPVTAQGGPLYYSRDHMEEGTVQYSASMLDGGDQVQNLPYRNLMGAQLLHDIV